MSHIIACQIVSASFAAVLTMSSSTSYAYADLLPEMALVPADTMRAMGLSQMPSSDSVAVAYLDMQGGSVASALNGSTLAATNALNATNTSLSGAIPTAALAGAAVTLPTITITEATAGALQTEGGGIGQVTLSLTNGSWDVAASQSATWCGNALPGSNIAGASSAVLTIRLTSISTMPCALVVQGRATAALTAAPGAAIAVTVSSSSNDTGQVMQVAIAGDTGTCACEPSYPATLTVAASTVPSGFIFTPQIPSGTGGQGKKADTYVIAYYQDRFFYKKKAPEGCAGWTAFAPQSGGVPQAYESGVILGKNYQLGNINDCDVTALKGVSIYVGYGIVSSNFGNTQTWNAMLMNGTFGNSPVFLTY